MYSLISYIYNYKTPVNIGINPILNHNLENQMLIMINKKEPFTNPYQTQVSLTDKNITNKSLST